MQETHKDDFSASDNHGRFLQTIEKRQKEGSDQTTSLAFICKQLKAELQETVGKRKRKWLKRIAEVGLTNVNPTAGKMKN